MKKLLCSLLLLLAPLAASSQQLADLAPLEVPQASLPSEAAGLYPAPPSLSAAGLEPSLSRSLPDLSFESLAPSAAALDASARPFAPVSRGLSAAPEKEPDEGLSSRLGRWFDLSWTRPEPTRRDESVVDDYFGTKVADPYRWLEDDRSQETAAWRDMQTRSTKSFLEQLPYRDSIKKRLEALWSYERFGAPSKHGRWWIFRKNDGLQNQDVLYKSKGPTGKAEVLLDPNKLSTDGTVALGDVVFPRFGRYMAYSLSKAGSDWKEWRVRNVDTGKDLPDVLRWSKFTSVSWSPDGFGFYYVRFPEPSADGELTDSTENGKVFYHKLGTPQDADRLVYERPDQPKWGFETQVTRDGRWLVLYQTEGTDLKSRVYVKDLRDPNSSFQPLFDRYDATYSLVRSEGERFWFLTTKDAPRGRLIQVDLSRREPEHWTEALPQNPGRDVLEDVTAVGRRFVAVWMSDVHSKVTVHGEDGALEREIALPAIGKATFYRADRSKDDEGWIWFTSFTHPETAYRVDLSTGRLRIWRKPKVRFDPKAFEVKQVFYPSKDGTRIPMFIVHKKGLKLDGANPTLLYGYGGFNISETPSFAKSVIAWMEMGGVYALANLRGGGEYGDEWHDAGRLKNKQNVFDDFIAAAEHLIREGYTSVKKLAIEGGSNGGLLVGAALTQRPDLFGAAVPRVGVLDMLRFHLFTIGHAWRSDYGSSETKEGFETLIKYSPLHNIKPGTAYPPTLVMTSDHDDRVVPAHSHKFTAALQAAQAGDAPILTRIEANAGHGAGKPISKILDELADKWAFLKAVLRF